MSLLKLDYFRGSMYFNDREHLTGFHYELFVANYFVRSRGCVVIHQGKILGKEDKGIDLIAISRETTYLIQCKCWLSPLSTDVFTSVKGSAELVTQLCHLPGKITPVVASHSGFYRDALETSNILGVEALYLPMTDNHALHDNLLSNYIDGLPVDAYYQRVPDIFEAVHAAFYLVDVDKAAEQELQKSGNQKLQETDQPGLVANQNNPEPEQSMSKSDQTANKPNQIPTKTYHEPHEVYIECHTNIFHDDADPTSPLSPRKNSGWTDPMVKYHYLIDTVRKNYDGFDNLPRDKKLEILEKLHLRILQKRKADVPVDEQQDEPVSTSNKLLWYILDFCEVLVIVAYGGIVILWLCTLGLVENLFEVNLFEIAPELTVLLTLCIVLLAGSLFTIWPKWIQKAKDRLLCVKRH